MAKSVRGWQRGRSVGLACVVALAGNACSVAQAQTPPHNNTTTTAAPPGNATPAFMSVRPPRTTAGIAPDAIRRVVTRSEAGILGCYRTLLGTDAHAHGVVTVHLNVIAGGTADIDRVHFTPRNATLEQCITGVLQAAEWPNPHGAPSTSVDAQFDLSPTSFAPAAGHGAHH